MAPSGARLLYIRRREEDRWVVEHNMPAKLLFDSHVCDKEILTKGWEMYLAKYIAKAEPSFYMKFDNWELMNDVQKYLSARIIGRMEVDTVLLGFHLSRSSHPVLFLPTSLHERRAVLKPMDKLPENEDSKNIFYADK